MKSYVVKVKLTERELKILGVSPEIADFNDVVRREIIAAINKRKDDNITAKQSE